MGFHRSRYFSVIAKSATISKFKIRRGYEEFETLVLSNPHLSHLHVSWNKYSPNRYYEQIESSQTGNHFNLHCMFTSVNSWKYFCRL